MKANKKIPEAYLNIYERGLSRVWEMSQKYAIGTITAFRNAIECNTFNEITKKENKKRNSILRAKLLKLGYGITSIDGSWINNYESGNRIETKKDSYLVVDLKETDKLKSDLIKLGTMFEQDSIAFSEVGIDSFKLISTNRCADAFPGNGEIGVEHNLGKFKGGKDGNIFSSINERPFLFENIMLIEQFGATHARSILEFAEMEITQSTCDIHNERK